MSWKWVRATLSHSRAKRGAYTVLLVLADRADDAGSCWPSEADIAAGARLESIGHVRRLIRELERLGEVTVARGGGRRRDGRGIPSTYQIQLPVPPGEPDPSVRFVLTEKLRAVEVREREKKTERRRAGSTGSNGVNRAPARNLTERRRATKPSAGARGTII